MNVTNGNMPPIKRKRGRPRKTISLTTMLRVDDVKDEAHDFNETLDFTKSKRQRTENEETLFYPITDNPLIGQQVIGVLEGTFDAGYFLSLKIEGTGTILRGVVFSDCIPSSNNDYVAPSANLVL